MPDSLLTIKLYAPPLRPGLVSRPRLIQKLNQGFWQGSCLTLFSAPAGYGKTILALEWLASLDRPFTWLSLDRGDNHALPFLTYLTAALQKIDENIGQSILDGLEEADFSDPVRLQGRLTRLLNQIAGVSQPFVLVLDDYHCISDLAVHQILEFLIDHQPPVMHLVITTRQDPLLPLSRLRSRGQINEIRLADLRFSTKEAATFLNGTMHLGLEEDQVASLEARTEGWIAGLQLAALSLSEMPGPAGSHLNSLERSDFIHAFAGDDRHIMDYLLDEVLSRQPEEVQHFLLATSVLKRLSGPLCNTLLTGGSGSQPDLPVQADANAILEYLERANLFIIPLDNRRQWYRYHHLFAELLNNRLQATQPEGMADLHCLASQWYENEGMASDAVDHALMADDFGRALRLIEHTARTSIWTSGDLPVLLTWSKRLPENVLLTRPRLCLYYARALFFVGQVDTAESYLQAAEDALQARDRSDKNADELWGVLCTNKATFAAMRGEPQVALALAGQAHGLVSPDDPSTLARLAHALGTAHYMSGDVPSARAAFAHSVELAEQANNRNLGLDAISCLASSQLLLGELRQAERTCEDGLNQDPANRRAQPACAIYLVQAEILYEQNNLPAAEEMLRLSIELGQKAHWVHILWQAYALLARILPPASRESQDALQQALLISSRYRNPFITEMMAAVEARADLANGDLDSADRWVGNYQDQSPDLYLHDFQELTLARIRMTEGQLDEALAGLDCLLESARANRRGRSVLHACALRGLCLARQGNSSAGLEALTEALTLAEPEGFIRLFIEEGAAMGEWVARVSQMKAQLRVRIFARRLLESFANGGITAGGDALPRQAAALPAAPLNRDALVEPLSDRELEVLGLIAEGLSNPEIAARLFLSVNTLRAHTSNIYQKLDVHSRLQAVNRAREVGLLRG